MSSLDELRPCVELACILMLAAAAWSFALANDTSSAYGEAKLAGCLITKNYRRVYWPYASNDFQFNPERPRRGENSITCNITPASTDLAHALDKWPNLGNLSFLCDLSLCQKLRKHAVHAGEAAGGIKLRDCRWRAVQGASIHYKVSGGPRYRAAVTRQWCIACSSIIQVILQLLAPNNQDA